MSHKTKPEVATMGLRDILDKLQAAKDLITKGIPDGLDSFADVLHNIEETIREGATYLRNLGEGPLFKASPDFIACKKELEEMNLECEELCSQASYVKMTPETVNEEGEKVKMNPLLAMLAAKALQFVIKKLLERLN